MHVDSHVNLFPLMGRFGILCEYNIVLARQDLDCLDPLERLRRHLLAHLRLTHLVQPFPRIGTTLVT
jgi:hypothetical protein